MNNKHNKRAIILSHLVRHRQIERLIESLFLKLLLVQIKMVLNIYLRSGLLMLKCTTVQRQWLDGSYTVADSNPRLSNLPSSESSRKQMYRSIVGIFVF